MGRVSCTLLTIGFVAVALVTERDNVARTMHTVELRAAAWKQDQPVALAVCGVLLVASWIVCLIPSTPIELMIGYLYGLGGGFALVYSGKVLGCLGSFLLGRTLLRSGCQRRLMKFDLLRAIDLAVHREPFRISFLTR